MSVSPNWSETQKTYYYFTTKEDLLKILNLI